MIQNIIQRQTGSSVNVEDIWKFFKCFYLCHFEAQEGKKDWNYCVNRLSDKVTVSGADRRKIAKLLMSHLYRLAGFYAGKGGSLTKGMLLEQVEGMISPQFLKSAAVTYTEAEKTVNNELFKRLVDLELLRDSISSLALKVSDRYYQRLPYVSHGEEILKRFPEVHDELENIKNNVLQYNNIGSNSYGIVIESILDEFRSNHSNLIERSEYNLGTRNSFSLPNLSELAFDYTVNRSRSEIATFKKANFFSIPDETFGYALERSIRGAGVQGLSYRIITSDNERDTQPERLFEIIEKIGDQHYLRDMAGGLESLYSTISKNVEIFRRLILRVTEAIDLNSSFK
jgi:hypothetical protein